MTSFSRSLAGQIILIVRFLSRLKADRKGNVLMIMGFATIPLVFAAGMTVDYARATRTRAKLNAAADAAALAAVSQTMMTQTNQQACTLARNMFLAQSSGLDGLVFSATDPKQLSISLKDSTTTIDCASSGALGNAASTDRTAIVTYRANSSNVFAGILGIAALPINGSSQAYAAVAPNIDFYLALDTSLSMGLPTTSAGLALMDSKFTCTFACHSNKIENVAGGQSMPKGMITGSLSSNPYDIKYSLMYGSAVNSANGQTMYKIDSKGTYVYNNVLATKTISNTAVRSKCADANGYDTCVYNADGTFVDTYWYAQNQGISLRVTAEKEAVSDLMTLATSYAAKNKRTYQAALYTFDHVANIGTSKVAALTKDLASVATAASKIELATVNDKQAGGCPLTGCVNGSNNYLFTSFYGILNKMLNGPDGLPSKSGKGTDAAGDTPQAYFFLVTDGMSDEDIGSGRTRAQMQQAQINQCTAIKSRGVKIAVLYTEYTTASVQDDEPVQRGIANAAIPNIAPALASCASSPDLFYTVHTDESISDALQLLFTKAIQSARLMK
jgi:Flp pilus assembly protein TadG